MTTATDIDKPARAAAVFEGLLGILLDKLVEERAGRTALLRQAFDNVRGADAGDEVEFQRQGLDQTIVLAETNTAALETALSLLDTVDQARTDAAALCQSVAPPTNDDRLQVRMALIGVEHRLRECRDKLLKVVRAIEENGHE